MLVAPVLFLATYGYTRYGVTETRADMADLGYLGKDGLSLDQYIRIPVYT